MNRHKCRLWSHTGHPAGITSPVKQEETLSRKVRKAELSSAYVLVRRWVKGAPIVSSSPILYVHRDFEVSMLVLVEVFSSAPKTSNGETWVATGSCACCCGVQSSEVK